MRARSGRAIIRVAPPSWPIDGATKPAACVMASRQTISRKGRHYGPDLGHHRLGRRMRLIVGDPLNNR